MLTTAVKLASSLVPADPTQWGNTVHTELVQRLPKIEPFIEGYRLVYSNQNGEGLGLIILQGGKAFIPTIIKEWRTLPIEVIVHKKGNDTKYSYLSERNLLKLLISSSLGTPTGMPRQGVNNAWVNLFSPAGGYGARTSNPWVGRNMKVASQEDKEAVVEFLTENFPEPANIYETSTEKVAFATEELKKYDFWKDNQYVYNVLNPKQASEVYSYAILEKDHNDQYQMYTHFNDTPIQISEQDVKGIFHKIEDPLERVSKVASFENQRVVIMGNLVNREGSYFTEPSDIAENTKEPQQSLPAGEGIFYYNGSPMYINPKVSYLDGAPCYYALAVKPGAFCLSQDFFGFTNPNTADSSLLSRAQLLPVAQKTSPGSKIVFYDTLDQTISIPCELVRADGDLVNIHTVRVKPLLGLPDPVDVTFYKGNQRTQVSCDKVLMPANRTQILLLPDVQSDFRQDGNNCRPTNYGIRVEVSKGGSDLYSVKEGKRLLPTVIGKGALLSTVVKRYGFGAAQAYKLCEDLPREKVVSFYVPYITGESETVAKPTASMLPNAEKEALALTVKMANMLSHLPSEWSFDSSTMDTLFRNSFSKLAAADANSQGGVAGEAGQGMQNPQQPMASSGMQGQAPAGVAAQSNILSYLSNTTPIAKGLQEIIDTLTYYAMGRFKQEEVIQVISETEDYLVDVENKLAQLLLLTQFGRVPGMEFSDTKVLLSDIDSYLTRILSSRVLLKDN